MMSNTRSWFFTLIAALLIPVGVADTRAATNSDHHTNPAMKYPPTRRVDQVDEFFGTKVPDPYRWLEADVRESDEVATWVKEQNKVARAYLDAIPQRAGIAKRLSELWNYERYSAPREKGGKYFYSKNDGLQNQAVLYVADSYKAEGRVLIDPNTWSKDGTIALSGMNVTEDGRYVAYSRTEAGSDWQTIYVMEVDSGKQLDDQIKWSKFGGVDWLKDGSGFYYTRYPEPKEGEKFQASALNQMIYFHKLGTKQGEDKLVYRRPDHPDWHFGFGVTDDGKYLILDIARSTDPQNQVLVREAAAPVDAPFKELIGDFDNQFSFVGNVGTKFYFLTDLAAPTKRIVTMDINQPGREHLTEIVPARKETLDGVSILSDHILCQYMVDVLSEAEAFDMGGKPLGRIELPGKGTVEGFGGDQDKSETFYIYTSYNLPASVYRYDVLANESELVRAAEGEVRSGEVHRRTGLLQKQRRHAGADDSHLPQRLEAGSASHTALRLRRLQHPDYAGVQARLHRLDGNGRRPGRRQYAGRRRIRRGVAPRRQSAQEAKCVRRLYWRCRMADRRRPHVARQTCHHGRQQRRTAGGGRYGPAARPVRRLHPNGRRARYAAFSEVHRGPILARRIWLRRKAGRFPHAVCLLALPQHQTGNEVSAHADHDGRHRRSRGTDAQLQVRCCPATGTSRRCAHSTADRIQSGPRPRHAGNKADRERGRPLGVFGERVADGGSRQRLVLFHN